MLYTAGFIPESIVDGPGLRSVIFFKGCVHHCKGCHNKHTWPFENGMPFSPEELLQQIQENPLIRHVTLSGGDPLCQNLEDILYLISLLKDFQYDVIVYTGFSLEEVKKMFSSDIGRFHVGSIPTILDGVIFVTDPFIEEKKSLEVRFRGSTNQRVSIVQYHPTNETVEWKNISNSKEWTYTS